MLLTSADLVNMRTCLLSDLAKATNRCVGNVHLAKDAFYIARKAPPSVIAFNISPFRPVPCKHFGRLGFGILHGLFCVEHIGHIISLG